jgi:tetratricopeptide (TPR) repeat protein
VLGNFNILNLNLPAEVSLSRAASWNIAKNSIKEDPILGSGPSTFYYSFSKFRSSNFNSSPLWNVRFDSSSGIINESLATVGILGAISLIVVALIALSISFLTLIKTDDKEVNSVLLALFSSFISAILFAVLFTQSDTMIMMTVLISIVAISAALVIYPEKFKSLKLSFRASAKYALALAAIFLCVSAGVVVLFTMGLKMYMADLYARKSLDASQSNVKVDNLNKAIALAPYQDAYYLSLANQYMALANQEAVGGRDPNKIQTNLSLAIERGKTAVDLSPNKAANNESLALIYENASFYTRGALEWAESLYQKVIELDPNNPVPNLRIALVNMAKANTETDAEEKNYYIGEAIKKYDESIAKKQDLAAAHYGKAIAYEKMANLDDAIEQL